MIIKRIFIMVLAFTVVSSFAGVGAVKADLEFVSMQGTWWISQKQMDKGYLFIFPLNNAVEAKAKKYTQKVKGYMYIPISSWVDGDDDTYNNIQAFDLVSKNVWELAGMYNLIVLGGTPIDFAAYGSVDMWSAFRMVLTMRCTVKEDKKNLGKIKSGKFQTLGSAVQYVIPPPPDDPVGVFVGTRAIKGKYVPADKVPQEVKDLVQVW